MSASSANWTFFDGSSYLHAFNFPPSLLPFIATSATEHNDQIFLILLETLETAFLGRKNKNLDEINLVESDVIFFSKVQLDDKNLFY